MWDRFFRQRAYIEITRSRMRWYVRKKVHQVEVIELCLAKLATRRILSKGLKNFLVQLINSLSDSSCKDFALC